MDILSKEIPVVGQGDNRQAAHGNVFTDKEVGREALAIPLIGANGTNDVLGFCEGHGYADSRWDNCAKPSKATEPSSSVAAL